MLSEGVKSDIKNWVAKSDGKRLGAKSDGKRWRINQMSKSEG